jgi:hypothetical protein
MASLIELGLAVPRIRKRIALKGTSLFRAMIHARTSLSGGLEWTNLRANWALCGLRE